MNTIINLTLALVLSITGVTVLQQEQDTSAVCTKSTKISGNTQKHTTLYIKILDNEY
mgnify:FL=1